jgi:hypothetical protein
MWISRSLPFWSLTFHWYLVERLTTACLPEQLNECACGPLPVNTDASWAFQSAVGTLLFDEIFLDLDIDPEPVLVRCNWWLVIAVTKYKTMTRTDRKCITDWQQWRHYWTVHLNWNEGCDDEVSCETRTVDSETTTRAFYLLTAYRTQPTLYLSIYLSMQHSQWHPAELLRSPVRVAGWSSIA